MIVGRGGSFKDEYSSKTNDTNTLMKPLVILLLFEKDNNLNFKNHVALLLNNQTNDYEYLLKKS